MVVVVVMMMLIVAIVVVVVAPVDCAGRDKHYKNGRVRNKYARRDDSSSDISKSSDHREPPDHGRWFVFRAYRNCRGAADCYSGRRFVGRHRPRCHQKRVGDNVRTNKRRICDERPVTL